MAAEVPVVVIADDPEPMHLRLRRVLAWSETLSPKQRAQLLARAGIIKPSDIEKAAGRLKKAPKRRATRRA